MKQKRYIMPILVVAFSLMIVAHAAAERTIVLEMGPAGEGAQGEVVIADNAQDQKEITINASGLQPKSVYTVWLVSVKSSMIPFMKPKMEKTGLGEGDYSFKTDDTGDGQYAGAISTTDLEKWQMLKIAHHPDGDPTNMKNMEIALNGDLK